MLSNIPTPLFGLWQHRIGYSTGTTTVIFAAYIGGLLLALPFTGALADRYGARRVLTPALAAALVSCVLFMTAGHVLTLITARLLTGVAVGAVLSAGTAAVVHVGGPARRTQASLAASVAIGTGLAAGPLAGGAISQYLGAPTVTAFVFEGVLLLTAVAVVLVLLPRPPAPDPQSENGAGPGERAAGPDGRGTRPGRSRAAAGAGWLRLPSVPPANRRGLVTSLMAYAPGMTGTSLLLALGPTLLGSLLDTTDRLVTGGIGFLMFGASTAVQFLAKRLPTGRVLAAAGVVTGLAMLGTAAAVHSRSLTVLACAAVLAGIGQGMSQYGGFTRLATEVPAPRLAEANAALSVGGYLFAGILPVLTGYATDATGVTTSATAFASLIAAAALSGTVLIRTTRRRPPRIQEPGPREPAAVQGAFRREPPQPMPTTCAQSGGTSGA
ncbi:MFS transporter [Streptomyces roseicoloratus]|uniref:MFS transporter n=1 Tax=Streptomyces roseicoloratus TaxID=2508722 RepID=A0ABY9RU36_9ACTN|nr:MFS transporter [Streptomyces roseicoloratus]WMX45712.1 MFS transporter [Streptomyces roseicoloratus]